MRSYVGVVVQARAVVVLRQRRDCRSIRIRRDGRGHPERHTPHPLTPPGAGDREPNRAWAGRSLRAGSGIGVGRGAAAGRLRQKRARLHRQVRQAQRTEPITVGPRRSGPGQFLVHQHHRRFPDRRADRVEAPGNIPTQRMSWCRRVPPRARMTPSCGSGAVSPGGRVGPRIDVSGDDVRFGHVECGGCRVDSPKCSAHAVEDQCSRTVFRDPRQDRGVRGNGQ